MLRRPSNRYLSLLEIGDDWSREIHPPRSKNELVTELGRAWWRGEFVATRGPNRLKVLRDFFKNRHEGLLFWVQGEEEPQTVWERPDGSADIQPVPVLSVPSGAPESWTEEECVTAFQVIAGGWGSGEFDMMEPSVTVVVHLSERDFTRWIEEFGHTRPDFWIRGSADVKVPLPEEKGRTAPRAVGRRVRTSLIRDAVTAKLRALIAEGKFTPVALNKMSDAELMYQTGAKRTTAREARTRLLSE